MSSFSEAIAAFKDFIVGFIPSAYVTALIALIGVLIAQVIQVWTRNSDRKHALKRDVYLPAADAVAHMQTLLTRAVSLPADATVDLAAEYVALVPALTRLHLVAPAETVHKLLDFQMLHGEALKALLIGRANLVVSQEQMRATPNDPALCAEQKRQLEQLVEVYFSYLPRLSAALTDAVVDVRRDLGLKIDRAKYEKAIKGTLEQALKRDSA